MCNNLLNYVHNLFILTYSKDIHLSWESHKLYSDINIYIYIKQRIFFRFLTHIISSINFINAFVMQLI